MLVDELNQLHSNYINLSTNHSETSVCILKVVISSWVSPSVSDSGLNNVRLNTVTDNLQFGCVRFSSFVVVEQPKRELLKLCPLLEKGPGAAAHLHLKGPTQKHLLHIIYSFSKNASTRRQYLKNCLEFVLQCCLFWIKGMKTEKRERCCNLPAPPINFLFYLAGSLLSGELLKTDFNGTLKQIHFGSCSFSSQGYN